MYEYEKMPGSCMYYYYKGHLFQIQLIKLQYFQITSFVIIQADDNNSCNTDFLF